MIIRKIDNYLKSFYNNHSKALLITGARQIGKTYSIRAFGKTHFKYFFEINFLETPDAKNIFALASNSTDIILRLSAYFNKSLVKGHTLIFFDEVQECPEIVTAIKFLVEEGSFQYILSGSLLGVDLKDIRSIPVGYLSVKKMYPLDIEEFCWAVGLNDNVIATLKSCYDNRTAVDPYIHDRLLQIVRLYLIVGGMPAAVKAYIKTNDLKAVIREQNDILDMYKKDIARYDPQHKLLIEEIFKLIPAELNAKNKRFVLKKLNENTKFSRFENSFLWLADAGVV